MMDRFTFEVSVCFRSAGMGSTADGDSRSLFTANQESD